MRRILFISVILALTNYSFSQSENNCSGGSFEIIKPFLGTWEEYTITDNGEKFMGTLESKIDLKGCVISQRFVSKDSNFSYLSFGYVEPSSNIWEETYVFSNGSISKYEWMVDGDDVLQRRIGGTRKIEYMHQLRLTNINKDSYDAIEEHSYDGEKTWEKKELTRIIKVK